MSDIELEDLLDEIITKLKEHDKKIDQIKAELKKRKVKVDSSVLKILEDQK
jgi:hypothetical protein